MDLLKPYLRREVLVLVSNEAVQSHPLNSGEMLVHEIEGTLTAVDDGHPMLEITTKEGSVCIVNWHHVVSVIVSPL